MGADTVAEPKSFNIADIWEAVSDRVSDREAVVCGEQRRTYAQMEERANRLANHLREAGIGPGEFVGCYLPNCIEYLETMLACFKIRAVPVNINYRYVAAELEYLFHDGPLVAVICPPEYMENVTAVGSGVDSLREVLVTGDGPAAGSGSVGSASVLGYEATLASGSAERPVVPERGNDDMYVIYTGGTTGLPKGVVWRMEDAFFGCLTGGDPMRMNGPVEAPGEMLDRIIDFDFNFYALAPLMHAAAQWVALMWFFCGAKVILHEGSFDPLTVWRTIEQEKVSTTTVVGDAMARPLADAWDSHGPFEVDAMFAFSNGGAPLAEGTKQRLMEMMPNCVFTDGFGSSETGIQGSSRLQPGQNPGGTAVFDSVADGTRVLDDNGDPVEPGSDVVGRIAHSGYVPLRYHNAPEKTAESFREIDGRRWVISGDMATVGEDGAIHLLGRGSVSINTGGEKVYPEEVESVLKDHPVVYDVVVVGVPHERWGEQVTAVVQLVPGADVGSSGQLLAALAEHAKGRLASYKSPRSVTMVEEIQRSPAGKADYRWARTVATNPTN